MQAQKKREEISDLYKWDLTKIYKNNDEFYNDIDSLDVNKISEFKGKIVSSASNLLKYLEFSIEM